MQKQLFAPWRTGLPRPVLVLQAGNALSFFGTGLVLPFEIVYLHAVRGFSTATAGLVLGTVMGAAALVTLPSGALLDRFSAKRTLVAGNVMNALGYGGLAFIDRPWQGFLCSAVGGAGFGFVGTASQVMTMTLVPAHQRAASTALRRVSGNFGIGLGATAAGFIVAASRHSLPTFQALYLFDMVTFAVFAVVVLAWIPDLRRAAAPAASEGAQGFRTVARDRLLLALIAGNLAFVLVGGTFFTNILSPFALAHAPVGAGEIGVVVLLNTFFIVVAQVPATRVVARMRRTRALLATGVVFAFGLLAVLPATLTHSTVAATTFLACAAIVIAIAECGQFVVLGPLVAEIAPPHLLGRYMSLLQGSFTVGAALGPVVGGVLLATSPDAIWWGGALAMALTGAAFARLGNRIPDPLVQTTSPSLRVASEAT